MVVVEQYAPTRRWRMDTLITMLSIAGQHTDDSIINAAVFYISTADDLQVGLGAHHTGGLYVVSGLAPSPSRAPFGGSLFVPSGSDLMGLCLRSKASVDRGDRMPSHQECKSRRLTPDAHFMCVWSRRT
jgi:hypothetical protein